MMFRQLTIAVALTVFCFASGARAQSAQEVVEGLNRDAMDAYNNLDINKAGSMLEEALRIAQDNGVVGPLMAITNLNLGIVYIGGLGDQDGGLGYFVAAMCADPSVQLDPLTSTPEIQLTFTQAQQQAQGGACGGAPAGPPMGQPMGQPMGPPPGPAQVLAHVPPTEQMTQTPLPIYAEVNGRAKIYLYYKGLGMEQYKRVTMTKYFGGVAYQVSCNDVWEPGVSYYIEAHGPSGIVGGAGTPAAPIQVPIVSARTMPEPALPGATTPNSCAAAECPPGMECPKPGTAGIGESCDSSSDCQSGLSCSDDACTLKDPGPPASGGGGGGGGGDGWGDSDDYGTGGWDDDEDGGGGDGKMKRWFIQAGFTAGLPYVQAGMTADRPAPTDEVYLDRNTGAFVDPTLGNVNAGDLEFPNSESTIVSPWVPDGNSFDSYEEDANQNPTAYAGPDNMNSTPVSISGTCSQDDQQTGPRDFERALNMGTTDYNLLYPSKYCVRVKAPGFAFHPAMRMNFGYFITDALSVAAIGRFQFGSGKGTMAGMLVGARAELMLTGLEETGFSMSIFTGLTVGQIQAQPPASGTTDGSPWIISGMQGGHFGSNMRIRFMPNFGMFIAPEFDVQFPSFLMNVDVTIGPELAF